MRGAPETAGSTRFTGGSGTLTALEARAAPAAVTSQTSGWPRSAAVIV